MRAGPEVCPLAEARPLAPLERGNKVIGCGLTLQHNTTPLLLALDSGILATQNTGFQDLGVVLVMGRP